MVPPADSLCAVNESDASIIAGIYAPLGTNSGLASARPYKALVWLCSCKQYYNLRFRSVSRSQCLLGEVDVPGIEPGSETARPLVLP